ncbi:MAG: sorbosone dehydrogenase family protein [Sphingomicrobium sp.]
MTRRFMLLAGVAGLLASCGSSQDIPPDSQFGATPQLPDPSTPLITQTHIPEVVGWKDGEHPLVPRGFAITRVAEGLSSPRNILPLANGDVLVVTAKKTASEPLERPKDLAMRLLFAKAHGGKEQPSNQLILLRDSDGDGRAEQRMILLDKLNAPHGIDVRDGQLYIGATDEVLAFPFAPGATRLGRPRRIIALPEGPFNHHWTKDLVVSPDGTKLYVGIGSNSNIMERGPEAEANRAAIWEVDIKTGAWRIFASGLRNPNGLNFYPGSNNLWTVVNERDELGPNLVPDYLTSVKDGGFYGWPYSYYGRTVDVRAKPARPDLVASAIAPDYALSSHVAPLGLAFAAGTSFPAALRGGAFVGEHGSWNSGVLHGYRVVFIAFSGGKPVGNPRTFAAGFIGKDGKARGRPVAVRVDRDGALLIADDAGSSVWRVSYSASSVPSGAAVGPGIR